MARLAFSILGCALLGYLIIGSIVDIIQARRRSQTEATLEALAEATLLDHDGAGAVLRDLKRIPAHILSELAMTVPLHFDDQVSRRILSVVGSTNLRRRVQRLSRSRFWLRRVRAARLAHILPSSDTAIVEIMLQDPSASVQAAAIESFGTDQISQHAPALLELLSHQNATVRFTAQQALLRGDSRITPVLVSWLSETTEELAFYGLEVAANLDDPRLVEGIREFATADDPKLRRLVARATPEGASQSELAFFQNLFTDPDPSVRATVITSSTRIEADWLIPRVANGLTDPSWDVRRAAGRALSDSGDLGRLYLRKALVGVDPYAADTARNFLEFSDEMEGLVEPHFDGQVDSLLEWAAR